MSYFTLAPAVSSTILAVATLVGLIVYLARMGTRITNLERWFEKIDEKLDQVLVGLAFSQARARGGKREHQGTE